ncbi:MAG: threonine--tRNA ligase [Candidatus Taylorbacteria bacterium]|nr:threonine--tRNA ligase [Candidatus Taylorbacteria bacterium]
MKENNIEHIRHTLAHLLASAVLELYPGTKNTIGPAIDDGFYYDFEFPADIKLSDKDLPALEKKMKGNLKQWTKFTHKEVTESEAKEHFKDNPYKLELIEEIAKKGGKITLYTCGDFTDLCRGGHAENPAKEIPHDSFKLSHLAGAYWRGSEENTMLTRIYGLAFPTKLELDDYETMREEAEKRDHKKLGRDLGLYMFHETSPGMPYWLPKGLILYKELENYWRKEHTEMGYKEISSPLVNKAELWKKSGHWDHYKEDMFIADMGENEVYGIKPMNCPNAMIVFDSMQISYKDLPFRLSDTDRLHRYERSGTLNGLLRCRSFQQDDSHNFISEDMIASEYEHIMNVCKNFYGIFNLEYKFRLGTRPKSFLGEIETWNNAEKILKEILEKSGKDYFISEGDGAFYGPKIDIIMKDSLGRDWQMGTMQLDFQLPQRFDLHYTDKDGKRKMPIVIHRVIYGSLERFIGILVEHTSGNFPLWLAPTQVKIIPVGEAHHAKAVELYDALREKTVRVEIDLSDEGFGKKVRQAKVSRAPYFIIIGHKDIAAGKVTLESRDKGQIGQIDTSEVIMKILREIKERK